MDQTLQDILEKAAKLKNLADRAGTPEEAAVAATKLQALLLRYNLDMQSVQDTTEKGDYITEEFLIHENRNHKTWACALYGNIAKNLQCAAVQDYYVKGQTPKMTVVGRKHNVQVVNYLFAYLHGEIKRLADRAVNNQKGQAAFHRAFCVGATTTVCLRLKKMYAEIKLEPSTHTESSYAVMVVEEQKVCRLIDKLFPHTRKTRSSHSSPDGFHRGKEAGKSIPLNRGVEGHSFTQLT